MRVEHAFATVPLLPIIQTGEPAVAVAIARALAAAGMPAVEVVLRHPQALECIAAVTSEVPGVLTGAGTVADAAQAKAALERGAAFIVSPGLDDGVLAAARQAGVPVFPGISTPTELQRARNLGLRAVKFFPATLLGGVAMLEALSSVFPEMCFMPTGGISPENLDAFLALDCVLACGGSWMTPAAAVAARDYAAVTAAAADAIAQAAARRPAGAARPVAAAEGAGR